MWTKTVPLIAAAWALTLFGHDLAGIVVATVLVLRFAAANASQRGIESALASTVGALARTLVRARRAEGWTVELLQAVALAADNDRMSTKPTKQAVDEALEQVEILGQQIDLLLATRRGEVGHA